MLLESYAKLNLHICVLGLRNDGFHNIKTIFERIDLCDRISLKVSSHPQIKVSCANKDVPSGKSNLVYRSIKLLQDKYGIKKGAQVKIFKRIPVGAGLGGGSGNAASVLSALNRLWGIGLSRQELARCGATIGSDVAFFIHNCSFAVGSGRGEMIRPLKSLAGLKLWHILVVPKLHVSTPLVYKKWDTLSARKAILTRPGYGVRILKSALRRKDPEAISKVLFNGLQPVTQRIYPEVTLVKNALASLGAKAILMSGSGPAVFGITSSRKEAQVLAGRLKKTGNPWQVFVVKTV